ncbi:hypothetical protein B0A49_00421 [Cryomyces minteri]|uniref:RWD domain-containing protein n=1 Tax=Cryomyces minteri TaxID=331657 RepID=A0A4U0Y0I6_9PEZI|nr:hypothetical protein B0A49_00421 [Cryomyces minteri]
MNPALEDEIASINAIYDASTLVSISSSTSLCTLQLPSSATVLRLEFPPDYPDSPPVILGTQTAGAKGEGKTLVDLVTKVLRGVFRAGDPCVFGLVEEVEGVLKEKGVRADVGDTQSNNGVSNPNSVCGGSDEDDGDSENAHPSERFDANAPKGSATHKTPDIVPGKSSNKSQSNTQAFRALIRTHHITSRKKVAKLKHAADNCACYVVLRSGGSPGIMYVEGSEDGVKDWVATVQGLRYKDYQLVFRPEPIKRDKAVDATATGGSGLYEMATVKEFGAKMHELGVLSWWRRGMGYAADGG